MKLTRTQQYQLERLLDAKGQWVRLSPVTDRGYLIDQLADLGLIETRINGGPLWPWREARTLPTADAYRPS